MNIYRYLKFVFSNCFSVLTVMLGGIVLLASTGTIGAETGNLAINQVQKTVISEGNLFIIPARNSSIIDILEKGDTVFLIAQEREWYIIKLPDQRIGWGHESLFKEPSLTEENVPDSSDISSEGEKNDLFQAVVRVRSARVRENPSLESDINFGLEKGTVISVMDKKDNWYFIQLKDGRNGWAYQRLFSVTDEYVTDSSKKIEEIRVEGTSQGDETVTFTLNGFYPPKTFVLNEEIPKIVCDFFGTDIAEGIEPVMHIDGKMVQKIRIGHHSGRNPKVRVVVDLDKYQKYGVEQVFFKKTNSYALTFKPVREESPNSQDLE